VIALSAQRFVSVQAATGVVSGTTTENDRFTGNDHIMGLTNSLIYPVGGPSPQPQAAVGGPLFDTTGHVIGVIGPRGGLGWSYSGDISQQAVAIWWASSEITYAGQLQPFGPALPKVYMGVTYNWMTSEAAHGLGQHPGALVEEVSPGSAAAQAGIRGGAPPMSTYLGKDYLVGGDVIVAVAGVRLVKNGQMATIVGRHKAGEVIAVRLWRHDRLTTVRVKLEAQP
jgi:S1-C subfamily serine protease